MEKRVKGAVCLECNLLPSPGEKALERLRAEAPGIDWTVCRDEGRFVAELADSHVAVVWRFPREWLDKAPALETVATPSAGHELIGAQAGPKLHVLFGAFHGRVMAETVAGMILALTRGIKATLDRQEREPWPRNEVAATMRMVRGSRAVVLGFGNIGKWIGRVLRGLGVDIAGVNRTDLSRPGYFGERDSVHTLAELDRLLPTADHLVLALPGGGGTDALIGAERLALLPPGAGVYNVGRGNAIDVPALVAALRSGRLAGAGLDVYPQEPLAADSPLRQCPNIILMPHVSAFGPEYFDLYFDDLLPRLETLYPGRTTWGRKQPPGEA